MSYLKTTYDQVEIEKEGNTLWIFLNRPEASNAFTTPMIESLVSVLHHGDMDTDIRCMVLSGRGKHFCAGGDIKDMESKTNMFEGDSNELRERYQRGIQLIPKAFMMLSTPIIAMINGAAIGAGLDISCMCDLRVASNKAKFGETFIKLGLIPGDGGTYFLQRIVGLSKAMEMTLTANVYTAQEADQMGLLNVCCEHEILLEETKKLSDKVCKQPPVATQMAKRAIYHANKNDLLSQLDLLAAYQGITQRTNDHFTALKAAKEKTDGDFSHK